MPRLKFKNNRDRVWTKNGRAAKNSPEWFYRYVPHFVTLCDGCDRLYPIDDETFTFKARHKTSDNIPHLYCDGKPGGVGIYLDAGSHKVSSVISRLEVLTPASQ